MFKGVLRFGHYAVVFENRLQFQRFVALYKEMDVRDGLAHVLAEYGVKVCA